MAVGWGEDCAKALAVLLRSESGRRSGDRDRLVDVARRLSLAWPRLTCVALRDSWADATWAAEWRREWVVEAIVAAGVACEQSSASSTAAAAAAAAADTDTDEISDEMRREEIADAALAMSSSMGRMLLARCGGRVRDVLVGLLRRGGAGVRWKATAAVANVLRCGEAAGRGEFVTAAVRDALVGVAAAAGTEAECVAAARALGNLGEGGLDGKVLLTTPAVRDALVGCAAPVEHDRLRGVHVGRDHGQILRQVAKAPAFEQFVEPVLEVLTRGQAAAARERGVLLNAFAARTVRAVTTDVSACHSDETSTRRMTSRAGATCVRSSLSQLSFPASRMWKQLAPVERDSSTARPRMSSRIWMPTGFPRSCTGTFRPATPSIAGSATSRSLRPSRCWPLRQGASCCRIWFICRTIPRRSAVLSMFFMRANNRSNSGLA